jgi:leader peptidase (prepilin peptidase)/N-methyltransferase
MEITLTIIFILLGVAVGSFLNVLIDRLPRGKSIVFPPSHCDACQHPLSPKDLVPVFSYLWLRGRCRYCGAHIPSRTLWVELGTGLLFGLIYWRYGLSTEFAFTAFFSCIFIAIIFIDAEHKLILNKLVYPASLAAIIIYSIDLLLPEPGLFPGLIYMPEMKVLSSIIGGSIGFVFFLLVFLIGLLAGGAMGAGDVKLAGLIGLVTGFPLVLPALFLGIVAAGLVAIVLLLFRIKGRKEALPYGAFLGIGPIVTLLWGTEILNWYLQIL